MVSLAERGFIMRRFMVSALALTAVVGGSFIATAGEARRVAYKPRAVQPVAALQVAQTKVVADPTADELRARIAELTKRVQALEAATAESRRQIANLSSQLEQVPQSLTRPVVNQRVGAPAIIITDDMYPNEYPYGG